MHQGTKAYLDGKIFLAPLENPQAILDVGYAFHTYVVVAYTL